MFNAIHIENTIAASGINSKFYKLAIMNIATGSNDVFQIF